MTRFARALSALIAALVVTGPAPAAAQEFDDIVALRVLPGWTTRDGAQMAGLEFTMAPGWHTYWRAPGEMGIPPVFRFAGSENLASVAITWPRPEVYVQDGYRSIVYHDRVVLPIELRPEDGTADIMLNGVAEIGVCADICVPMRVAFSADLPAGAATRTPAIAAALLDRPLSASRAGLRDIRCAMTPARGAVTVAATIDMPAVGGMEYAIFEHPDPTVWVEQDSAQREGRHLTARATFHPESGRALVMDRSALVITVISENAAVEIRGCPAG